MSDGHDLRLWFLCDHRDAAPGDRDYLIASAHTFPGRILAHCDRKVAPAHYAVSASTVLASCSDEARYWVQGFLAGSEPAPPRDAEGQFLPYDHPVNAAWLARTEIWHATGQWPDD